MSTDLRPFHLAFPVDDLSAARTFYGDLLGCDEGRSSTQWIDFNLYGHQIVTHLDKNAHRSLNTNPVDGEHVPVPHFGVVLTMSDRKSTRLNSSHDQISYAVFCLKKKKL